MIEYEEDGVGEGGEGVEVEDEYLDDAEVDEEDEEGDDEQEDVREFLTDLLHLH